MKLALCLSGHFRSFDRTWKSIYKHIIKEYQPDIFAHAWSDSFGNHSHPLDTENPSFKIGYDVNSSNIPKTYLDSVANRVNPKLIQTQRYFDFDDEFEKQTQDLNKFSDSWRWNRPKTVLSSVYSRCQSIRLKQLYEQQYNFVYDAVVWTRWDILHKEGFELSTPNWYNLFLDNQHGWGGSADIWAFGDNKSIDILGDQYDDISHLIEEGTMSLHPHKWLDAWLNSNKIHVHHRNLNLEIKR